MRLGAQTPPRESGVGDTVWTLPVLQSVTVPASSGYTEYVHNIKDVRFPTHLVTFLQRFHNSSSTVGHLGVERTIACMPRLGLPAYPGMRNHVKHYIRTCPLYHNMSMLRTQIATSHYTTSRWNVVLT